MQQTGIILNNVSFTYASASKAIFERINLHLDSGWTGVIGPNGSGKTTLLRLICRDLIPDVGTIQSQKDVIYCAQRTDTAPDGLGQFLETNDSWSNALQGQLHYELDWSNRWDSLSHGERKRAQIALALWRRPDILALDEPTNHVDAQGRAYLLKSLQLFTGIGLLVSHDRELLDGLCQQTLFIEPPEVLSRPGGYSKAVELAQAQHLQAVHRRQKTKQKLGKLNRERGRRAKSAQQADRQRSKRGLACKDSDGRAKKDMARYSGKDGLAGRSLSQLDGRQKRLQRELDDTFVKKQPSLTISLYGERYHGDRLFGLDPGSIALGDCRQLDYPELTIGSNDRIGIIGPNGTGKSTLIRTIQEHLDLPSHRLLYVPQEIKASQANRILSEISQLPGKLLGSLMTFVACLGSEPRRLLETDLPSPGELRKLMLALGMTKTPHLIILDEPTNHLDLPSIESMEKALCAYQGALLLVSHDLSFLNALVRNYWKTQTSDENKHITLQITSRP